MNSQKILILDYSVDRWETAAIKRRLPWDCQIVSFFIDAGRHLPGRDHDLIFLIPSAIRSLLVFFSIDALGGFG